MIRSRNGWIAPRSGGYRPGGDFNTKMATSHKPPKGGGGVAHRLPVANPAIAEELVDEHSALEWCTRYFTLLNEYQTEYGRLNRFAKKLRALAKSRGITDEEMDALSE